MLFTYSNADDEVVHVTVIEPEDTVITKGEHSYGDWINTDAENHWKECACGNKIEIAAHSDENANGKGDICGYNVGVPAGPNGPQTGDNSNLLFWFVIFVISALGIGFTVVFKKNRAK